MPSVQAGSGLIGKVKTALSHQSLCTCEYLIVVFSSCYSLLRVMGIAKELCKYMLQNGDDAGKRQTQQFTFHSTERWLVFISLYTVSQTPVNSERRGEVVNGRRSNLLLNSEEGHCPSSSPVVGMDR